MGCFTVLGVTIGKVLKDALAIRSALGIGSD